MFQSEHEPVSQTAGIIKWSFVLTEVVNHFQVRCFKFNITFFFTAHFLDEGSPAFPLMGRTNSWVLSHIKCEQFASHT